MNYGTPLAKTRVCSEFNITQNAGFEKKKRRSRNRTMTFLDIKRKVEIVGSVR